MDDDSQTGKEKNAGYLKGQLLIAMPALGDPSFKKSVTLICQHNAEGCFGLTINRPIQITLDELFDQLHIASDNDSIKGSLVLSGGPVQPDQGFVIHEISPDEAPDDSVASNATHQGRRNNARWENTLTISDDLAVTASRDILFDIAEGRGPKRFLLALGCASWTAGQLEQEMLQNSWLNCPADNKILFETPFEKRWNSAIDTLGFDINLISDEAGHA